MDREVMKPGSEDWSKLTPEEAHETRLWYSDQIRVMRGSLNRACYRIDYDRFCRMPRGWEKKWLQDIEKIKGLDDAIFEKWIGNLGYEIDKAGLIERVELLDEMRLNLWAGRKPVRHSVA